MLRRNIGVVVIVLLNGAVVLGNFVLGHVAALACSAEEFGDTSTICDGSEGWGSPALLLAAPTAVARTGDLVSLVRRRRDAAVAGLIAAPLVAILAWVVAWSI